ncbi:hypothetical protein [Gemmatimonas sp.]|uniref:hypothetical protein n=1 Tax=Gemmatimonas sp. TaxID=1962908 RepID=UPI003983A985
MPQRGGRGRGDAPGGGGAVGVAVRGALSAAVDAPVTVSRVWCPRWRSARHRARGDRQDLRYTGQRPRPRAPLNPVQQARTDSLQQLMLAEERTKFNKQRERREQRR